MRLRPLVERITLRQAFAKQRLVACSEEPQKDKLMQSSSGKVLRQLLHNLAR